MMRSAKKLMIVLVVVLLALPAVPALALRIADPTEPVLPPDDYVGDTAIYTLQGAKIPINVLFLIDNSYAAGNIAQGVAYDGYTGTNPYSGSYAPDSVWAADNQGNFSTKIADSLDNLTCAIKGDDELTYLASFKQTISDFGTITVDGSSATPAMPKGGCKTSPNGETYALGDFLNYLSQPPPPPLIVSVVDNSSGTDVTRYFSPLMTHISHPVKNHPLGPSGSTYWVEVAAGDVSDPSSVDAWKAKTVYEAVGSTQIELIYNALNITVGGAAGAVRFGAMVYGSNNMGGHLIAPIKDLTLGTNMNDFLAALPKDPAKGDLLSSNTARPAVGAMRDALAYYLGDSTLPISNEANSNPTPIDIKCQPNYIVYITNGINNENIGASELTFFENLHLTDDAGNTIAAECGDLDGDGEEFMAGSGCDASYGDAGYHYLDDLAKYMAEEDMMPSMEDEQHILTSTVLAFQSNEPLVLRTGDSNHGQGKSYQVFSASELAAALKDLILNIVRDANASFVAPVVPASPENRVRSGRRIYLGFFRPMEKEMWLGNLKKYSINDLGEVLALDGPLSANEVPFDTENSFELWNRQLHVDPNNPTGPRIYIPDEGAVDAGGVGSILLNRVTATAVNSNDTRSIYTFLGTDRDLSAAINKFHWSNTTSTANGLNLRSLMQSTQESFDDDVEFARGRILLADGRYQPRSWVLGDILHSKPNIFNYNSFVFNTQNEQSAPPTSDATNPKFAYGDWERACPNGNDCNKTVIYVGANDGMLHAFADASGEELWGFIPPNLLPHMRRLTGIAHNYYVDGSPIVYARDQNSDGNFDYDRNEDYTVNDRVVVLFGTRRGGGVSTLDANAPKGAYHALDVSDPTRPKFLFSIDSKNLIRYNESTLSVETAASGLDELGETFSNPIVRRVRIGTTDYIAMFVGAGYDNNEDLRWGSTPDQDFPLDPTIAGSDSMDITDATRDNDLGSSHNSLNPTFIDDGCGATSTTNCAQVNPRGRGIYIIEIARVARDANNVEYRDFSHAGNKLWGFTYGGSVSSTTHPDMLYSFPADLRVVDVNEDGLADRIYAGDTGGQVWRFDIKSSDQSQWSGKPFFNANPDSTVNGRKFFYTADYDIVSSTQVNLFISSGDREHPLNYVDHGLADGAVMDRIYMIKDFEPLPSVPWSPPSQLDETTHLVDLSDNTLQTTNDPLVRDAILAQLNNPPWESTPGKYGWMLKLNAAPGEKALSPPQEILGLLLQTTYSPNVNINDPCLAGNPGIARFYALKAATAEAFLDLDNDGDLDRNVVVGGGIPPEPTIIVTSKGVKAIIISEGEAAVGSAAKTQLTGFDVGDIETLVPVYWMQW